MYSHICFTFKLDKYYTSSKFEIMSVDQLNVDQNFEIVCRDMFWN